MCWACRAVAAGWLGDLNVHWHSVADGPGLSLPRTHGSCKLILVVLGAAVRLVPLLERHAAGFRRARPDKLPGVARDACFGRGCVTLVGRPDQAGRARCTGQMPPHGSPNVVLIVLDTVAVGHLSLYGYERKTTPDLVPLADQEIRFDSAQAPCTMDTAVARNDVHRTMAARALGRASSARWTVRANPTVAEYLGKRGYATAGVHCQLLTIVPVIRALDRGFTRSRGYTFPGLSAFKMAAP